MYKGAIRQDQTLRFYGVCQKIWGDKIIAVIVSYNRKKLLKEALEHLLHQQNVKFDILIIDNASTDGTKEYIVDYLQKDNILYHNTGANLGGAGGFSLGVKMGVEKGYDYVWIMDDYLNRAPD